MTRLRLNGYKLHSYIRLHGENRTYYTLKKRSRTTAIDQDCAYFVLGTVGQRCNTNMTKGYVKEKGKGCEMKFSGQ